MHDSNDNSFVKESYKGKKKLLTKQRLFTSMISGAIFGVASALVFIAIILPFLHIINNKPAEKVEISKIDTHLREEEISEELRDDINKKNPPKTIIVENKTSLEISDYKKLYYDFKKIATRLKKCTVKVIVEKQSNTMLYSTQKHISLGLIVAENKKSFFILTPYIKGAKKFTQVEIMDNIFHVTVIGHHESTGLMVIKLDKGALSKQQYDSLEVASLVVSANTDLGKPVIVYGYLYDDRLGYVNSQITSYEQVNRFTDSCYSMILTDVCLDDKSSGIVSDLDGRIVGFIDRSSKLNYKESYAITELQNIIERLSNGEKIPIFGIKGENIKGKDISDEINSGVFVTEIDDESPAMKSGVLPGDIIVAIDDQAITDMKMMQELIQKRETNQQIKISLMRQKLEKYEKIEFILNLK